MGNRNSTTSPQASASAAISATTAGVDVISITTTFSSSTSTPLLLPILHRVLLRDCTALLPMIQCIHSSTTSILAPGQHSITLYNYLNCSYTTINIHCAAHTQSGDLFIGHEGHKYPMHVRVLDVFPGSPAHNAGIRPFEDYLLGTDEFGVFCTDHDLEVALREHEIRLYVFHEPSKQLRVVKVRPDPNWGGKGSLGCDIGTGPAHQIPSQNGKMIVFKKE